MIKGFKMKLFPGMEQEYERRHNLLWDEMKDMIHEYGGSNYTIFLDKETGVLFGYLEVEDLPKLPENGCKGLCDACFTGRYPVEPPEEGSKSRFEAKFSELAVD